MKPLALTLQAFGPFAHRQVIDFRTLGDKTFFLIHGPTGSGKTSILDGICLALFGDSSGGERDGRQMRSHHADAGTLTELCFDFALGARRYRVRRVPEQMRPARRGGGETKQAPSAELCRIDTVDGVDVERPVASGWSKVNEAVVGLLGFESQQFRQVIMLPQGKFFEFLKSNSQEREKILQTLFGTALYKRIEEQLKFSATALQREADTVRTQRQTLIDQAKAEDEAALQARWQQQGDDLAARRTAAQTTTDAAQASDKLLAESRRVADCFDELDKATTALQALRGEEPAWKARRTQLTDARRAAAIHPYAAALAELDRQLDEETRRGKALAAAVVTAGTTRNTADAALERERRRAPERDTLIARIAELAALADKVGSLAKTRDEHGVCDAEASRTAAALLAAQQAHKAAADALAALTAALQRDRLQAAGFDGLRETHARLNAQLAQCALLATRSTELARTARQVDARQKTLTAADAACVQARTRRDSVRQAWVAGQAARLAHELVGGQACPVCGAHEHPAPAHAVGEPVLDATLKAAEYAFALAEAAQREAQQQLATQRQAADTLAAVITQIRSTLGEAASASTEQIKAQAEDTHRKLEQAEAAAKGLKMLDAKLPAAESAIRQAEAAVAQADGAARQAQARLQQLAGQLAEREAGIPQDLRDPAALRTAQAAASQRQDSLKQALDAATATFNHAVTALAETRTLAQTSELALTRLAAQRTDKAKDLDERLRSASFADVGSYQVARLDDEAINQLDTRIRTFEAALAAGIERQLRAAASTHELLRLDLAGAMAANDAAKAAQLSASNAVRDAVAARETTTTCLDALKRLAATYQVVEARYTVLKQVADVAGGNNAQRMSFQRYVLATLLEEVLAATTLRLRVMSRARYEMRRKQQPADQRAAAGLDLEVFDHYTGTTRAVSTLSGGESFLASLALALGLSDVVQSHAGGIRLDAIFVDEGFGTLDSEALDVAISALEDLQQAGRMVGIISHVAELKERMDARLELKATRAGSVAEFVV